MKAVIVLAFLFFHFPFLFASSQQPDSLLFEAVKSNNLTLVKELLQSGANVNSLDKNQATVLMWAVFMSDLEMVKYLVNKGADYHKKGEINLPDNGFYSNLLGIATAEGKLEMVKYFIEELKIPVNDKELNMETGLEDGWTALQWAVARNQINIAEYLIDKGADIRIKDEQGKTLLHLAGSGDIARLLIEKGAEINAVDKYGETPLHLAQSVEIASVLIENGANVNERSNSGYTPLHFTITPEIASYLIEKGADINARSSMGTTPLHTAGTPEIARLLIDNGADLNTRDEDGNTPLIYLIQDIANIQRLMGIESNERINNRDNERIAGHLSVSRVLIEKGADISCKTSEGSTLLSVAVRSGRLEDVRWLIEHGANVNAESNDGISSLLFAIENNLSNMARLLIENGADINGNNNQGNPLLKIAWEKNQMDIVSLLIEKGADGSALISLLEDLQFEAAEELIEKGFKIDACNADGQSTLVLAVIKSTRKEVIKFLLNHNADAGLKDLKGKTALDYALLLGKSEFVSLLSEPELIQILKSKGQMAVIEKLSKDSTGITQADAYGLSLLHYVVYHYCDSLLSYITKKYPHAPFLNILNKEHQSPLLYAIYLNNAKFAARLIESGADVNKEGIYGETPLYMAENKEMQDIVSLLNEKKAIRKVALYPTELSLPTGHLESINNVTISPDGKTFISNDQMWAMKLWDIATGKCIRNFAGKNSGTCFTPDGKSFISASSDRNIKLWDIETGRVVRSYGEHKNGIHSFSLSPDGKSFLSSGDSTIQLWDLNTGRKLLSFTGNVHEVTRLTFCSDGKYFISETFPGAPYNEGDSVENEIKLWDISSGKELKSFKLDMRWIKKWVPKISFSPDGKTFISASEKGIINQWDAISGKELRRFTGQNKWVQSVRFSPDGKSFISGYNDGTIGIWDITTGKELNSFSGYENDDVTFLGFLPDGKSFISVGYRGFIKQWDMNTCKELHMFRGFSKPLVDIDIANDGTKIVSMNSLEIKLMDIVSGKEMQTIPKSRTYDYNECISISPDCKSFLSGTYGIEDSSNFINSYNDSTVIKLFDLSTGTELKTFMHINGKVDNLSFSNDGKSFISTSMANAIVWDLASGKVINTFPGDKYSFLHDNKSLVSAAQDYNINRWDIKTGVKVQSLNGHIAGNDIMGFSPDGKVFASYGPDHSFETWDVSSGEELHRFSGHYDEVKSISFSPDGNSILSGSWDNTIRLWNMSTGLPIRTFSGNTLPVTKVKFYLSGKYFISFGWDRCIKFWNTDSVKEIASLVFIDSTDWVLFTPDKYYATTKNGAKTLGWVKGTQVWNFDQWDLQYNRPDIVFGRMPNHDTTMIKLYYKAYQKRLAKMNFKETMFKSDFHTPEIEIVKQAKTNEQTLKMEISAMDVLYPMDRINIWINDVPVYGINGLSLRDEKQTVGVPVKKQLSLELGKGNNKIEVSVLNSAGAESVKQVAYTKNESRVGKKDLYFIAISCADYRESDYNLKYSVKDGRDMARYFTEATNSFSNIFIDTLFNSDVTREKVTALKQKLLNSKVDDQVILFASGHGLLDDSLDFYFATYDLDFKHPERRGISFDLLENILDGIPARNKLLMMDACHSGEVDKEELNETTASVSSGTTDYAMRGNVKLYKSRGVDSHTNPSGITLKNSFELMQELFAGLDKGTGTTVISAAAGDGYALESPQWNNGVFTYSIINGLKNKAADKNGDGIITVSELKDYSIKQVQLLTGGKQKPTARRESINYDWNIR